MAHSVFVVHTVARVAASLNKTDWRAYDAAISGLKGEGCKAAGYRLAAADGGDFPMCCRHLANDWRMHTLFAKDHSVIVISLVRRDKSQNPHQVLVDVFPGSARLDAVSARSPRAVMTPRALP